MSKTDRGSAFPFFDLQAFDMSSTLPIDYTRSMLKAQGRVLAAMQDLTERWFENRQKGLDELMTAVGKISACKDPTEVAATQQQWIAGTQDRMMTELTRMHDDVVKLTQSTASAVVETLGTVGSGKKAA
ncbi:MAG TPA: phasin family protein [Candidatus Sulfotelmatobacter sp.]|nr:phasin family protein [Candidatus Sulfotelmatobacter sp.]